MSELKIINLRKRIEPPVPTVDNPLVQLDWIFNQKASLYENIASQKSYHKSLCFYKVFLKSTNNYDERLKNDPRFFLSKYWDQTAFYKVNQWIKEVKNGKYSDTKVLSSHTYAGHLSHIRSVMNLAFEYRIIDKQVLNVPTSSASKETLTYEAYSEAELYRLFSILDQYIDQGRDIVKNSGSEVITHEIIQKINVHMISSICMKLMAKLGTNLQPALDLKLSDYKQSSTFFNEPSITIFKNKTRKESELPLSIFSNDAHEIKELIELTIKLTSLIRDHASESDKDYLFIFMARGSKFGTVKRLSHDNLHYSIENEFKKHNLLADDGTPLIITPARLRPTVLNKKVMDGESLDVVKAISGHSSIKVTQEHYFDKRLLVPKGNKLVSESLNKIFKKQITPEQKKTVDINSIKYISKPETVEVSLTKLNSCLSCKSLVLTTEDLPRIFIYRKSIKESLDNGLANHPNLEKHYKKLLVIIDEILKTDVYFSEEELEEAKNKADMLTNSILLPVELGRAI